MRRRQSGYLKRPRRLSPKAAPGRSLPYLQTRAPIYSTFFFLSFSQGVDQCRIELSVLHQTCSKNVALISIGFIRLPVHETEIPCSSRLAREKKKKNACEAILRFPRQDKNRSAKGHTDTKISRVGRICNNSDRTGSRLIQALRICVPSRKTKKTEEPDGESPLRSISAFHNTKERTETV